MNRSSNRTAIIAVTAAMALAGLGFLAIGVFGVHTLVIDDRVDEANPFVVQAVNAEADSSSGQSEPTAGSDPTTPPSAPPEVSTVASGLFVDGAHPTRGDALVITDGTDERFLRFENFESDNGPDLNVYLRNPDDPDDYVDLGDLKGNIGSQNYELDPGLDLARYTEVDIWCVRFGVSFGTAQLALA